MWRFAIMCGIIALSLTEISSGETLKIEEQIMKHEGFSSTAYKDPAGNLAIGYGRNLEGKGLTKNEALYLLHNDIHECVADLCSLFTFKCWANLSEARRIVLIDMRYNLGPGGFRDFERMIKAVKQGDWLLAAYEIKNSLQYKVGIRGETLYSMMAYGGDE